MDAKYILGAATAVALSLDAQALTVTPAGALEQFQGSETTPLTAADFSSIVGPGALDLYFQGIDGSPGGAYADSYSTTFIPDLNPTGAIVSLIGGQPSISGFSGLYLYVKDGDLGNPAWYLFNISSWNGTESLELDSFWSGREGSITHLGIIGSRTTAVPDAGSTMILLGTGLAALGSLRRLTLC